ncbi:MAG: ribulose-phosphate 3-epimerase [Clostridia bacterium]
MIKISASILNCDFSKLGEEIARLEAAGVDMIHVDVMDGMFVPNITIGPCVVSAIRKCTKLPLDVHLMINQPERYIEEFVKAGADILTIHAEASTHLHRTLQLIKSFGIKTGVSLNPATPLANIEWILEDVDQILQMTVNPGFGGQQFIQSMVKKILTLKEMAIISAREIDIEVDGGINGKTIHEVVSAGANVIVAGAALFQADDMKAAVAELRRGAL